MHSTPEIERKLGKEADNQTEFKQTNKDTYCENITKKIAKFIKILISRCFYLQKRWGTYLQKSYL